MAASRLLRGCDSRAPIFAFLGFTYAGKLVLMHFTTSYFTATAIATEFHLSVSKRKKQQQLYTGYLLLQVMNPQKLQ